MSGQVNATTSLWRGSARIGLGWATFAGRAGDNSPHRHHAWQLALAKRGDLRIDGARGSSVTAPGVLVAPNALHRLAPGEGELVLIYVDAESTAGRDLRAGVDGEMTALSQAHTLACRRAYDAEIDRPMAAIDALAALPRRVSVHDKLIASVIDDLPRPSASVSVTDLAARAGLSVSRFSHRFTAYTGLPLRPFLRWRRLLAAASALATGEALTDAALKAGFSDAAHMSRTFRAHFGITPRMLRRLFG